MKDETMKFAVLLRGVNIGGRKVKSAELKNSFSRAGFENSKTVLATGNVIIESKKTAEELKPQIEQFLLADFKFPIKVLVLRMEDLKRMITHYPFRNKGSEFHRYVIFKEKGVDVGHPPMALDDKLEAVQPGGDVLYWCVLKGHTLDSDFAKYSAKKAKKEFSTTRNINTLEKVLKKAEG